MVSERREYPKLVRLYDVLLGLELNPNEYGLDDDLLNVHFFDCFTDYDLSDDELIITGLTLGVDKEELIINLKDKDLVYNSQVGDQIHIHQYTRNGFDLTEINLI